MNITYTGAMVDYGTQPVVLAEAKNVRAYAEFDPPVTPDSIVEAAERACEVILDILHPHKQGAIPMEKDPFTPLPLQEIGGAVLQLTYANMMDLAARLRETLLEAGVIDESLCSTHDVADALSLTATYLFTQEGGE